MTPTLEAVEAAIDQLSISEQLLLLEHLALRIRARAQHGTIVDEGRLGEMAADPAIQQEIKQIDAEFALIEADGLEVGQCRSSGARSTFSI